MGGIESIVNKKGKASKVQYLIKWKGSEVKTWEPKSHLEKYGAKEMIAEFENHKKKKKVKAKFCAKS